jgi:hypothetical protein
VLLYMLSSCIVKLFVFPILIFLRLLGRIKKDNSSLKFFEHGQFFARTIFRSKFFSPDSSSPGNFSPDNSSLNFYLSKADNSPLECYMWLSALKQLFRRHYKQFSALFLELDNKWMIEICSNTCDTHLLPVFLTGIVAKTTQNMQLAKLIL